MIASDGARARTRSYGVRLTLALAGALSLMSAPAGATPAPPACTDAVVLVHDMGSSALEWEPMMSDLRGANNAAEGHCSFRFTYGANAVTAALHGTIEAAGLTTIEDSAAELRSFLDSVRTRTGLPAVDVIAHGAGGLVTQYYLDEIDPGSDGSSPRVRSLTTLGPLWGGTNIAGLASHADFNKRLGIYEQLAALEDPLVAPFCPGCPQLIARSRFMTDLARDGYRTPGVRYTDIITRDDLLMSDPTSAAVGGGTTVVLQDVDPSNRTDHFGLADDSLARRLALSALVTE